MTRGFGGASRRSSHLPDIDSGVALEAERISVWYSVPSVLTLLASYGGLEQFDLPAPQTVCSPGRCSRQAPRPADTRAAARG